MADSTYKLKTSYPILAVGVSMVGFISIKTGRDAVFFTQGGIKQLPLAYIFIAIASVPAAMMHLKAIERWGSRKVRTGVFFWSPRSHSLALSRLSILTTGSR